MIVCVHVYTHVTCERWEEKKSKCDDTMSQQLIEDIFVLICAGNNSVSLSLIAFFLYLNVKINQKKPSSSSVLLSHHLLPLQLRLMQINQGLK